MKIREQTIESVIHEVLTQSVEHPETYLHQFVVGIVSKVLDEIRLDETPVFPIEETSFVNEIQETMSYGWRDDPQFMWHLTFMASLFDSKTQSIILTCSDGFGTPGTWISINDAEVLVKGLTNYIKAYDQKQVDKMNKSIKAAHAQLQEERAREREKRKEQAARRKARRSAG